MGRLKNRRVQQVFLSIFIYLIGSPQRGVAKEVFPLSFAHTPLATLRPEIRSEFEAKISSEVQLIGTSMNLGKSFKPVLPLKIRGPIGECESKQVYLLDHSELSVVVDGKQNKKFDAAMGSGGFPLQLLLAAAEDGKFEVAYDDTVFAYAGIVKTKDAGACPVVQVYLHSGQLGLAGQEPVARNLIFHKKNRVFILEGEVKP